MISPIDLDHVAIACEHHSDAWPRYAGDLGAEWKSGGFGPGFAPAQVAFANGMRLEVLRPHEVERNDFLRRFLDRNGPGPHHLTYKVGDLDAALAEVAQAGYRPVAIDRRDPEWQEAFLHPRDIPGVVVQLAQAAGPEWSTPPPRGWPADTGAPATLAHIAHAVAVADEGFRLFAGLLGGVEVASGEDDVAGARWTELAWPGPGRVQVWWPRDGVSPLREELAGRRGRVHHVTFLCDEPAAVPGARLVAADTWEVAAADNLGLRLRLQPAPAG